METEPDIYPTYIMFQKSLDGDIVEIVGPIFENEFEQYKEQFFDDSLEVQIMFENMFRHIYPSEYLNEFSINWCDYISSHLEASDLPFNFECQEVIAEDGDSHEVILSYNNFFILKDPLKNLIEIYFHVSFPVWWAAELSRTLSCYISQEFEFVICPLYFKNRKKENLFGEEAWSGYEYDKLYYSYSKN